MKEYLRNNPMHANFEKKCLAKTRKGSPCQILKVVGKKRCRMHGGAKGSGAPLGNQNAHKHGLYSAEALRGRNEVRALLKRTAEVLRDALI